MAKREEVNNSGKVSITAWQATLDDINARFDRMEEKVKEATDKLGSKVSITAWQKSLEEKGNEEINAKLQEIDSRLEKAMTMMAEVTSSIKNKVNVAAWDKLLEDNEDTITRLNTVENVIKQASLSEQEIKKLLETI